MNVIYNRQIVIPCDDYILLDISINSYISNRGLGNISSWKPSRKRKINYEVNKK